MNFTQELIKRQKELGRPVRVGLAGAGQMGSGLAAQIGRIPGMELVACADIDEKRAENGIFHKRSPKYRIPWYRLDMCSPKQHHRSSIRWVSTSTSPNATTQ